MSSLLRTTVAVALALAAVQTTAEAQAKPKQDRNRIDVEEVRSRPVTTVHQLIKSRRGHWLTVRGQATLQTQSTRDPFSQTGGSLAVGAGAEIVVYIDNARQGSQEVLRSINTDEIDSLEYFNAQAATQRFGTGHPYGAIIVHRRVR